MKKLGLLFMFFCLQTACLIAQETQVRVCSERDIPMELRNNYHTYAGRMLEAFYSALPFCMENSMILDDLVHTYFNDAQARYTPDFLLKENNSLSALTPAQYMQEFQKHYRSYRNAELVFEVSDISFQKDFYIPNMVSCYVVANYLLTVKDGDRKLLSRRSQAYCIFPSSSNWISVKLMQISPVEATGRQDNTYLSDQTKNKPARNSVNNEDQSEWSAYRRAYEKAKQQELEKADRTESIIETFTCEGRVVDNGSQGKALAGANVLLLDGNVGMMTDYNGNFKLKGVKEGDRISVSYKGYENYVFQFKRDYFGKMVQIPMVKIKSTGNRSSDYTVREEKVELLTGVYLKEYGVVCANFGVKANAEGLLKKIRKSGFNNSAIVFNKQNEMYRVLVDSFDSPDEAVECKERFVESFPNNPDFKKSWILKVIR